MAPIVLLVAVLSYHVPRYEAIECDSLITDWQERMGVVEVWYGPRYGNLALLREKDVAGREGQLDTLQVPDDTLATVVLIARDAAGNRSCEGASWTVAGRVGVGPSPPLPPTVWFDVQGRALHSKPTLPGIYWRIDPGHPKRRLVVIR